jgi:hypothetical protein
MHRPLNQVAGVPVFLCSDCLRVDVAEEAGCIRLAICLFYLTRVDSRGLN